MKSVDSYTIMLWWLTPTVSGAVLLVLLVLLAALKGKEFSEAVASEAVLAAFSITPLTLLAVLGVLGRRDLGPPPPSVGEILTFVCVIFAPITLLSSIWAASVWLVPKWSARFERPRLSIIIFVLAVTTVIGSCWMLVVSGV